MPRSAPRGWRLAGAALAAAIGATFPTAAQARIDIVDSDDVGFSLGGYARTFTGLQVVDTDGAPAALQLDRHVGLAAAILRTEWKLGLGDAFTLEVHDRLYWLQTSAALEAEGSGGVGLGVSTPPRRTVDLRSQLIDQKDRLLTFEHDLDRLAVRLFLGALDVTVGRQAITWGTANLFPVADLWATFSPFDLDTAQKRGTDAIHVLTSIGMEVELDFVLADRGSLEDLSGGARATFYLGSADVYVALGKFYEEIGLLAGVSAEVDVFKLRAEAAGFYDSDESELLRPRATLGVDWYASADLLLGLELHYNGAGVDDAAGYLEHLGSDVVARGETYLLGRYYAGVLASYKPYELVTLTVTALGNLADPSLILTWAASYEVAQDVELGLGAFHGLGAGIGWDSLPTLSVGSEFGAIGDLVYFQLAAFF